MNALLIYFLIFFSVPSKRTFNFRMEHRAATPDLGLHPEESFSDQGSSNGADTSERISDWSRHVEEYNPLADLREQLSQRNPRGASRQGPRTPPPTTRGESRNRRSGSGRADRPAARSERRRSRDRELTGPTPMGGRRGRENRDPRRNSGGRREERGARYSTEREVRGRREDDRGQQRTPPTELKRSALQKRRDYEARSGIRVYMAVDGSPILEQQFEQPLFWMKRRTKQEEACSECPGRVGHADQPCCLHDSHMLVDVKVLKQRISLALQAQAHLAQLLLTMPGEDLLAVKDFTAIRRIRSMASLWQHLDQLWSLFGTAWPGTALRWRRGPLNNIFGSTRLCIPLCKVEALESAFTLRGMFPSQMRVRDTVTGFSADIQKVRRFLQKAGTKETLQMWVKMKLDGFLPLVEITDFYKHQPEGRKIPLNPYLILTDYCDGAMIHGGSLDHLELYDRPRELSTIFSEWNESSREEQLMKHVKTTVHLEQSVKRLITDRNSDQMYTFTGMRAIMPDHKRIQEQVLIFGRRTALAADKRAWEEARPVHLLHKNAKEWYRLAVEEEERLKQQAKKKVSPREGRSGEPTKSGGSTPQEAAANQEIIRLKAEMEALKKKAAEEEAARRSAEDRLKQVQTAGTEARAETAQSTPRKGTTPRRGTTPLSNIRERSSEVETPASKRGRQEEAAPETGNALNMDLLEPTPEDNDYMSSNEPTGMNYDEPDWNELLAIGPEEQYQEAMGPRGSPGHGENEAGGLGEPQAD